MPADCDTAMVRDGLEEYTRALMARQEKELRGAWRAGYDYLYKISLWSEPHKRSFVPSDREKWPHSSEFKVERWDIAAVDDETIKQALAQSEGANQQ